VDQYIDIDTHCHLYIQFEIINITHIYINF